MLEKVKLSLRINNNAFDEEINSLIKSCKKELELVGIAPSILNSNDTMILQAITLYCKAHFGFDNSEAERYMKSYESLKILLSTNINYKYKG